MEQATRNKLRNVVTQCRKLLEESIAQQLEGQFGIRVGKKDAVQIEEEARMSHLSEEDQQYRRDLLDHFEHIKARSLKPKDALDQLIREIAFTHLNRLCAYKMMEAREVYVGGQKFRECVSRGINSNGFKFYLADHPDDERLFNTGDQETAYRHFLDWVGGTLSEEIGVLFNPNDPANRMYPRQKTLDELLDLLNDEELAGIWEQDETIGWVYQYFTPKELREQARKESSSPRNSYELAFRNQFFTPRYVVEFLTDNTLGRIWYEMRKGDTILKDQCGYLVRRPAEIFLDEGQDLPEASETLDDLSQEELLKQPVHIPNRPKKDPRELKILDPASGSGHFLLYCFDLLLAIYEEAYADPDLGPALQQDYPKLDDLRRDVPRLILAHNLHGIDIDLRASQIAALALWLRCQRAYQEIGLKKDRPKITRSNLVCAEPMPGEATMFTEFVGQLEPSLLGQLVTTVFEKMKLCGQTGSLHKVEQEIRATLSSARKQWVAETTLAVDKKGRTLMFSEAEMERLSKTLAQPGLFDIAELTDEQFFERAEQQVVMALRSFSEQAQSDHRLQRRLFSEDAVRGFSFVEVCHKTFDVILMNPPFGDSTPGASKILKSLYPHWNNNALCAFIERAWELCSPRGRVGVLYDRTAVVKSTYEEFRRHHLLPQHRLVAMADLGWEVLDANVEVTTCVLARDNGNAKGVFMDIRRTPPASKGSALASLASDIAEALPNDNVRITNPESFMHLPNAVLGYDFPEFLLRAFDCVPSLKDAGFQAFTGHQLKAEKHFRLWWEISHRQRPEFYSRMFNGAGFQPYATPLYDCAIAPVALESLPKDSSTVLRNREKHGLSGVCFGKRGEYFCVHVLPPKHICTVEGQGFPVEDKNSALLLMGLLNTPLVRYSLNRFCGQHKYSGYVNLMPFVEFAESSDICGAVKSVLTSCAAAAMYDETQPFFSVLSSGKSLREFAGCIASVVSAAKNEREACEAKCHTAAFEAYQVSAGERRTLDEFQRTQQVNDLIIEDADLTASCSWLAAHSAVSHALGIGFGRWAVATGKPRSATFEDWLKEVPSFPPAMLTDGETHPVMHRRDDSQIDTDGIVVDDAHHADDIVRIASRTIEVLWPGNGENIEHECCKSLRVDTLREYFQKPGKCGFWDDHIKRYSKRGRKAPIYWLLQSSKKNYGLWLYYHRLDKDMLFKALLNYVEPKIQREDNRLGELRSQKNSDDSGKAAKKLGREIEKQEDLLSELRDFEEKLRKVADLHLVPDLNDGVVLNIAPLHELVPWKEAKKHWDLLMDGKYEWSSIGKQLREKGLVQD